MLDHRVIFMTGVSLALGLAMITEPVMSGRIPSGWRRRGLLGVKMALEMVCHVCALWFIAGLSETRGPDLAIIAVVFLHVVEFGLAYVIALARTETGDKPSAATDGQSTPNVIHII